MILISDWQGDHIQRMLVDGVLGKGNNVETIVDKYKSLKTNLSYLQNH